MKMKNRIWIELDKPQNEEHAKKQCELANNMLSKLGDLENNSFFPNSKFTGYCFGGNMGYTDLKDNGKWFNLDYLGRNNEHS